MAGFPQEKEFTTHFKEGKKYHSFEKEIKRLGIIYLCIKPYRPQTNGKVEAFWKIIKREFLTKYLFKDWREFNFKLHQYLYRHNNERRHSGINYLTPVQKLLKLERERTLKENQNFQQDFKDRNLSTEGRVVEDKLPITFNHFVTEVVR